MCVSPPYPAEIGIGIITSPKDRLLLECIERVFPKTDSCGGRVVQLAAIFIVSHENPVLYGSRNDRLPAKQEQHENQAEDAIFDQADKEPADHNSHVCTTRKADHHAISGKQSHSQTGKVHHALFGKNAEPQAE